MSLFFNMLCRLVITFLPRSKRLLISWLQSPSAVILEPKKIKSVTVYIVSPSICHELMGLDAMIFIFWMLNFKPVFSFSSFTFTKRPFSCSLLSAVRVGSYVYLRLLIFLLAILIPACASSSPAFLMIYSGWQYTVLTYSFSYLEPVCCPCPVLTVASWPAYRFLRKQVRYSHLLKNCPQFVVIYTVKDFGVINIAEVDGFFLEFSCFLYDPMDYIK